VRKTVWESRPVDLQIESEKLLQIFSFFQKQKPALLQKKKRKGKKAFPLPKQIKFVSNYN